MKNKKMYSIVIVIASLFLLFPNEPQVADGPKDSKEVWIEVHDVGANYDMHVLQKVIDVLDKHPDAYDRKVLFVIPNYDNNNPFHENLEFTSYLKSVEKKGYILGLHGYSHNGLEFAVNKKEARVILSNGLDEFEKSGFKEPYIFLPPSWKYTNESLNVALENFSEFYTDNGIFLNGTFYRFPVHEYTNNSLNINMSYQLEQAKRDYNESKDVYRISMHLAFAYSDEHLEFLDKFLGWIEESS